MMLLLFVHEVSKFIPNLITVKSWVSEPYGKYNAFSSDNQGVRINDYLPLCPKIMSG